MQCSGGLSLVRMHGGRIVSTDSICWSTGSNDRHKFWYSDDPSHDTPATTTGTYYRYYNYYYNTQQEVRYPYSYLLPVMEDYEKECQKRKARAEKFGTTYVPPKLEDFLPWTEVKRIKDQADSNPGFASGIDMMDSEEVAKREARQARFGVEKTPAEGEEGVEEKATETEAKPALPVSQAWDKEAMLRPLRADPPQSLWMRPQAASEEVQEEETRDAPADPPAQPTSEETPAPQEAEQPPPTWVPEKLHLSAIDWAAFKQIRNKDIMAWFSGYAPTYIEWLGDVSCNVCFGDKHTATRAMLNLAQDIPSPPPPPPPKDVAQDSQEEAQELKEGEDVKEETPRLDLGNMTWKFCRQPIRKVANDKYGRRGTTARVLIRLAMSTDILQERPNAWPAPPGGFSKSQVLGPNSDFKKSKKKRSKRAAPPPRKEQRDAYVSYTGEGEHPMMGRGLAAGRGGFSVEELEQERAAKRAKTS
eukprot:Nitzschia sp. Nitz4//scaffold43_size134323//72769//74284//NITZ4_003304-RA/size134323-processed-gene-0.53-mRNA-1//-1//CDS//3329551963//253//frame0